ncbi:hypothetical protein INR49_001955 [Caranx melampygus]|nr:hypothetical protein INR49_001955 [Caranx melampygus]
MLGNGASHDLKRLQSLLAKTSPRQEVAVLSHSKARSSGASRSQGLPLQKDAHRHRSESDLSSEASELEKFRILHELQGISSLARYMESVTTMYMSCGEQAFSVQKLVTMTYMFQKLSAAENQRAWVIASGAHKTLVKLLSVTDSSVLVGALLALSTLAERISAELLRLLSPVQQVREQVRELEGLPVLLSQLHGQHLKLLWSLVWVLVQLCEDPDSRAEIRSWGGVQQLLWLLNSDKQYVSDRSSIETLSSANAAGRIQREHVQEELSPQEEVDNTKALQSACCTVLTELSLDDTSAHHIVQENGIYIIAKLILPQKSGSKVTPLQCYAFRTLRFLFSVERHRHLFKRLFPTDLFELFIDVGHYVRDLTAYEGLQTKVSLYTKDELDSLRVSIETVDQNRPPLRVISGYSVLDHLGTGAFGSVFKVRKQSGQNLLALKEVNLHNPVFGKDKKSRDSNMCLALRYLHKEKRIVHRDLTPNNIMLGEKDKVTITDFGLAKQKQENSKLTSVVGTILYSCPEVVKNEPYGEKADIWALGCILYQMATLQPPFYSTNMLSLASKATQRHTHTHTQTSYFTSNIKCFSVHLSVSNQPFLSLLCWQIVEAVYEPVEAGAFSDRVTDMIRWCLSPDADQRPDIVAVSSRICDLMMRLMDGLYTSQNALERRAERDRKRAQRYFLEQHKGRTNCCISKQWGFDSSKDETKTSLFAFHLISVSAGICVSQKKLRQIDDPSQRLLMQLHKIIYITQLPPAPHHNIKRRVIERFKKSLFLGGSDPYNLKVELSKLLQASTELMEVGSASSDWWPLIHHITGDPLAADTTGDGSLKEGGIIEELLEENSYYETTDCR